MKNNYGNFIKLSLISITLIFLFWQSTVNAQNHEIKEDTHNLKIHYFGQKPPDTIPELFAPGIVSINGQYEYGVSFSPNLEEIYYSVEKKGDRSSVYYSKLIGDEWTKPQKVNFTKGKKQAEMEAFVTPDGKKVFFTAYDSMNVKIWYADRTPTGWGEAKKLDSPVNNDIVFYSTIAANGDLYYTNISKRKQYFAPRKNGKYPEVFEAGIQFGGHGFISPNKDILLVDAFKNNDKTKDKDIYVCFKNFKGQWTEPINLGINTEFNETCPSLSPDGKYIFFSRYNEEGGLSNIYWVSAKILDNLKPVDVPKVSFERSKQKFLSEQTYNIEFGDIDNDGDKDMVCANMGLNDSKVWLNDGNGHFTDSGQKLTKQGHGVQLADLDKDGDLDIFITCAGWGQAGKEYKRPSKIYFNNGKGVFTDSNQNLGDSILSGNDAKLVDIDNDGDLDVLVIYYQEPDILYKNDGKGFFKRSDDKIPESANFADVDNDGDLDMVVTEMNEGIQVLLNDGNGNFKKFWSHLDTSIQRTFLKFVDLDKDNDLDFIMTNSTRQESFPTKIYLNNGKGEFSDSEHKLGAVIFGRIAVGDINCDNQLDIALTSLFKPNELWLNDMEGNYYKSSFELPNNNSIHRIYFEDLDDDKDLDIIIANFFGGANEIWFNKNK